MFKKIVPFQKLLYKIIFSQLFDAKQNAFSEKGNKYESIILVLVSLTSYLVGIKLFGGLMGIMVFSLMLLPHMYRLLCVNESIIFYLPLKRSFVISNLFIFSTSICVISPLLFGCVVIALSLVGAVIGAVSSPSDIAMLQVSIILSLYSITYVNGLMFSFFVKNSKLRITHMLLFSTIYIILPLYIYKILPKTNQPYFMLTQSLQLIPNSWLYIGVQFFLTLVLTLAAIFISIKIHKPKKGLISS